jgi:hypothetical protein
LYSDNVYSATPVDYKDLVATAIIVLNTSALLTRSLKFGGSFNTVVNVPLARLAYTANFDPSHTTVTFGTSARLVESAPLSANVLIEMNIPNAPIRAERGIYAAFTVDTYFPFARMVATYGYRAVTTVDFALDGMFTRSGNRDFTANIAVTFDIAVGPLYGSVFLTGDFAVQFGIDSNEWIGPAWETPPDVMPPWVPVYPPSGPWVPSAGVSASWSPTDQTRYFDG